MMTDCVVRLQELEAAEQSYADVCNQIAKAERFFPVPGIGQGESASKEPPAEGVASTQLATATLHEHVPSPLYHVCDNTV